MKRPKSRVPAAVAPAAAAEGATPPSISGPVVLDSSALLAFLHREPGSERVARHLRGSLLSAVNYSEVLAKSPDAAVATGTVRHLLDELEVRRVEFGQSHAETAAALREPTRALGLSLGDRASVALAIHESATVLTADRAWAGLSVGITIHVIR